MSPDPKKVQALMAMPLPKCKKELQSFLCIINHLTKSSPMTDEVYKPLEKLTPVKDLHEKGIIRQDAYMYFHDTSKPLYMDTDTSSIGLGLGLLHLRDGMNCGQDQLPDNTALCPIVFTSKMPIQHKAGV